MEKIVLLLSTYNGHNYLAEQIESIINQSILKNNNFQLSVFVRDDGSSDDTLRILQNYSNRIELTYYQGDNVGPAKSFWELVHKAPSADYYAFCDQDDVWFSDKIERAISALGSDNRVPKLYCSSVTWTDATLNPLNLPDTRDKDTSFPHALLYSVSPGCTFVFNSKAIEYAKKYSFDNNHIEIHDWLLFKIVSMLGVVYYDKEPGIYYRQHGNNTIGRKNEGFKGLFERAKRLITSEARGRSYTAASLMNVYINDIGFDSTEFYYLDLVANYRKSFFKRIKFLKEKQFRRNNMDTVFLIILIILGKV